MEKYIQIKKLAAIFDLSKQYFEKRMQYKDKPFDTNNIFVEGVHFFRPPSNSKTKKIVLWHIESVEAMIRNEFLPSKLKEKVQAILS